MSSFFRRRMLWRIDGGICPYVISLSIPCLSGKGGGSFLFLFRIFQIILCDLIQYFCKEFT